MNTLFHETSTSWLTETSEGLDPSAGSSALGAAKLAPATNFGVMVWFNNVIYVFVWVYLKSKIENNDKLSFQ